MNICLVSEEYPLETNFGGIATYQKRLAETLVSLGHSVYVIARGLEKNQEYQENGVNVIRIKPDELGISGDVYQDYRIKVAQKLEYLVENNNIDIIESPDWGGETVFYCDKRKVPLVVRLHTPLAVWTEFNESKLEQNVHIKMLEWERKTMQEADIITSCTEILKGMVKEYVGLERDDIVVIPNPGDTSKFYPIEAIRKENKILYCGSLEQRKGVLVLAEALNIVFKEFDKLEVIFVGKDTNRNSKGISTISYIKELVSDKYKNRIKFYGQLKNEELNEIYNKSQIAVFPSLFDNLPYVVMETMLAGTPIIGSRNSGMPEMFVENDSGDIYETGNKDSLANKIINLLNDKDKMERYSCNARKKAVSDFNAEVITKQTLEIYQKAREIYNARLCCRN